MATKNNKSKGGNGVLAAEIGAGLIAAAAGAGYYFYASDNAKRHRKIAAVWAEKMRRDVIKQAKTVQAASPKAFAAVVDQAALAYGTAKNVRREDVLAAAGELKKNFDKMRAEIERSAKKAAKKPVKKAKKTAKKIIKKAKKKARG